MEVGGECVFPIVLWKRDALAAFVSDAPGPVNVLRFPQAPADAELGVARINYAHLLHHEAMEQFARLLGFSRSARADE